MTVSVFADTNLFINAESEEQDKTSRAIAIIQNFRVISTQVINEAVSVPIRKHGFLLSEAHEIAESLLDLCEVVAEMHIPPFARPLTWQGVIPYRIGIA